MEQKGRRAADEAAMFRFHYRNKLHIVLYRNLFRIVLLPEDRQGENYDHD